MQIAYYDEAGDDGFPQYSSPLFVLSALYLHYLNWKPCFESIRDFRRHLMAAFGLPVKLEMHTRHFILNKNPYRTLGITDENRKKVVDLFCDLIASLEVKIINVVIVKTRIRIPTYDVLDMALTYSVQRIENDLNPALNPNEKLMIITDSGRVGKMRHTTRKIQKINFIPSRFSPQSYRREIQSLIEDPLPKESKESYFIQLADLVSYVVYLHSLVETGAGTYPNRLSEIVEQPKVIDWMERLK
jgi:hypothetical protein